MKISEDHIIAVLVILIIFVLWSKFTLSSGYGIGQGGTAQTMPMISIPGKDINIANWTAYATVTKAAIIADTNTTLGVAIPTPTATDNKLGPGDLNRQGWAASTAFPTTGMSAGDQSNFNSSGASVDVNTSTFQFVGFRKQLQPGGGGAVWYLFSYSGSMPSGANYLQSVDTKALLTVGTLTIPQFVIYLKSTLSPFPDSGCVYVVTGTGACSATQCTNTGGTAIQTLKLVKQATVSTAPCLGADGTTDLTAITTSGGGAAVSTYGTAQSLTATGAGGSGTTPNSLTNAGAFTASAAVNTQCFFASKCYPPGCSGGTSGFLQNTGTVFTIAGTPGTSGTADGVGTLGSLVTNDSAATFTSPTFICASGTASTVSNVVIASVSTGHTLTTIVLRDMFKEFTDKPPLWQTKTRTITIPNQTNAPVISGLAVDNTAACPVVYVADTNVGGGTGNNIIYKITNFNSSSPTVVVMTLASATYGSLAGLWIDATTVYTTGSYLYALTRGIGKNNLLVIPTGTFASSAALTTGNMMVVPTLTGTPGQMTSVSGVSSTCYYTDVGTPGNALVYKFTIPAYVLGTATAPTVTQYGGGGNTGGSSYATTGGVGTGSLPTPGQLTIDSNGNLYVPVKDNNTINKLDTGGNIFPFVGGNVAPGTTGQSGSADTGGSAGAAYPGGGAKFNAPLGLTLAPDGLTFFVADTGNNSIRIIT
jgi:hypothetical protein